MKEYCGDEQAKYKNMAHALCMYNT